MQTARLVGSYGQSRPWVAVAFLLGCHAGGAAHPLQPLVGMTQPPTSSATPTTTTATETANSTSTASSPGAAEAQATGADDRENATSAVGRATTQIDRLRRMQRAPDHENRDSLDATLDDLESARKNVLQDLRAVELEPGGSVSRAQLRRHIAVLRSALDASYEGWPPTGQEARHAAPR